MSVVTFNGITKIATLAQGVTSVDVSEIYFEWKKWTLTDDNLKFEQMFRYVGGDPTINGQYLGVTFFLSNQWRIKPQEANHILQLNGNIFTDEGDNPLIPTIGKFNVTIQNQVSSLNTVREVSTSGSNITAKDIRDEIMNTPMSSLSGVDTFGGWIANGLLSIKKFIGLS